MSYIKYLPGDLVKIDGIYEVGIVIKNGTRESLSSNKGKTWEEVVLVLVGENSEWYNHSKLSKLS
jgi:hypothetical protein